MLLIYDDVIKWKHFQRYCPFGPGIHQPPVDSPHKVQWREALMFSLICAETNSWANNPDAGDLRRHRANHDVTVMQWIPLTYGQWCRQLFHIMTSLYNSDLGHNCERQFQKHVFGYILFREILSKWQCYYSYFLFAYLNKLLFVGWGVWRWCGVDPWQAKQWASCHIRKIADCACAGDAGNVFPCHRGLAIPTCITARAWRTCRDTWRDR